MIARRLIKLFRGLIAASALLLALSLTAQTPPLINYQGRVVVSGTNFNGAGQFKFALVNSNASVSFWSNDGSSAAGSQPAAGVPLTVNRGNYFVLLGDTNVSPNMTPVPATVFTNSDVRLRVWFNDGANGFQLLSPDQRIAAVGYAVMAATIPDGAITSAKIAAGAVGSAQLVSNSVTASKIANGSIAASSFAVGTFVPHDGVILSDNASDPSLLSAGFVKIHDLATGDFWQQRSSGNAPAPRREHTAVWTGSEMIVWGGISQGSLITWFNDGARFNPALNTWTAVATGGAPSPRSSHTAVWTGSEMIVWGGSDGGGQFNDGARYDPGANTWTALPTAGAPAGRDQHTAVWNGGEMIIWGGFTTGAGIQGVGGRYSPVTNSWRTMDPNPFAARIYHTAVWAGNFMIIWGGSDGSSYSGKGWLYDPVADSWFFDINGPSGRWYHSAVSTGPEMIVWGGFNASGELNDGARYNPTGFGSWSPITGSGAPAKRSHHTAVWTGTEMIVWGGSAGLDYLYDGGRYNPTADTWTDMTTQGAPSGRYAHTAVWTGNEMIVFGGRNSFGELGDTFSYRLGQTMYLYVKP